ncbi:MAG TPA: AMP-binding protein [Candidatus Binatia bacterium]|nr:AMP-binding protein [Candidatus Binatia bacterium]
MVEPNLARTTLGRDVPSERLRAAVDRARRSEFYSRHLTGHALTTREDLARLPLTFKHHLQEASPFGMLAVPPASAWHYHETSGTTGVPTSTWCGLTEVRMLADTLCSMVPELSEGAILLNRFPLFAPASFIFEQALQSAHGCHIPAGNLTWDVPFLRALGFIRRLEVTALACLPFEAMLLRELALAQGLDFRREVESVRVIFCGGAALPTALRRTIENDWDARVVEIYGSNEAMGLGISCPHGKLHLCTDLVEIEVLDPQTHVAVLPGDVGVLTVTSLVHEVMPLVRYVTDDLVRMDATPCPCGDERPTGTVLGRLDEVVELDGHRITQYELLDAVYEVAERIGTRVFFVLIRHRGLHVIFEAESSRLPAHEAERALRDRLRMSLAVEFVATGEVLDRGALVRTPKIYKPGFVSDWRGAGKKSITIMEAMLEWPRFDLPALLGIATRQIRNARRRRRLLRDDRL